MRLNGFSIRSKTIPLPVHSPVVFSYLKSFNKTLAALEDLTARNKAVAAQKTEQAIALEEQAEDLLAEAQSAEAVAKNIREMLGA
ncbi:MAG: hypothetical protein R3317_04415 [Burkholderiaceae bacterium]|nr:hypothetical protein [Burkholderiaceae bacterium]